MTLQGAFTFPIALFVSVFVGPAVCLCMTQCVLHVFVRESLCVFTARQASVFSVQKWLHENMIIVAQQIDMLGDDV